MNVHAIIFGDDGIHIEYSVDESSPFTQSIQLRIPYQAAQLHPQLAQDMQELAQDAQTVLDAALMAKVGSERVEGMGRP